MTANVALTDTFDQWRVKSNELIVMTQTDGMNNILKTIDTTNSTSNTTGSIITAGGVGITKSVTIGENLQVHGNVTVAGDTTISGNLVFGDADTDQVTFTADINSHIIPNANLTFNIGNTTMYWANTWTGHLTTEQKADSAKPALTVSSLDQDVIAIDINAGQTTANIIDVVAANTSTGKGISLTMAGLSTGSALYIDSDSDSTGTRSIAKIIQNHASATGATALALQSDAGRGLFIETTLAAGGYSLEIDATQAGTNTAKIASAATTGTVLDMQAEAITTGRGINYYDDSLTTGSALYIDSDSASTGTRSVATIIENNAAALAATALTVQSDGGITGMTLDKNFTDVAAATVKGLHVDFDRTVPGSGTAAFTDIGIDLDVNSAGLGTTTTTGLDIDVVGATSGTHTATGINVAVGSADTNYPLITSGGNIGISTAAPATIVHITGTDAIVIPVGTTAQRGTATAGGIRYNSTTSQFEGYSGSSWGSLGGLIDVDQDTKIIAETSAGADNDDLDFYTAGTQRMKIDETGIITVGVDGTGYDVKMFGDSASKYWMWDQSADKMIIVGDAQLTGVLTVGVAGTGHDVYFYGDTSGKHLLWDQSGDELLFATSTKLSFHDAAGGENILASADGHLEVNAGTTLDITAPTVDINVSTLLQIDGAVSVGVNDTGHNIIFYGASDGALMRWNQFEDTLEIRGAAADATTSSGKLQLSTAMTDVNDGDVIGRIDFLCTLEAGTGDSRLAGATIWAEADATFTDTVNSTDLVFATGTTSTALERVRITSAGKVGIGVAAPQNYLHIASGDADNDYYRTAVDTPLIIETDGDAAYIQFVVESGFPAGIVMGDTSNSNDTASGKVVYDSNGGGLIFGSGGAARAYISTTGNVGIGQASPAHVLDVTTSATQTNGMVSFINTFGSNGAGAGVLELQGGANDAAGKILSCIKKDSGDPVLVAIGTGNVGIGIATPWASLDIYNLATGTATTDYDIALRDDGGVNNFHKIGFGYATASTMPAYIGYDCTDATAYSKGALIFGTRPDTGNSVPTERMRIADSGNVGIGIVDPGLHQVKVKSSVSFDGSTASTAGICVTSAEGTGRGAIAIGGNDNCGLFNYSGTGLGIQSRSDMNFYCSDTNDDRFGTKTLRMTILNGGNVGIGIAAPGQKFVVYDGYIKAEASNAAFYSQYNYIQFDAYHGADGSDGWTNTIHNTNTSTNGAYFRWRCDLNGTTTEHMRIQKDGKIGMGTAAPATILHLNGTGTAAFRLEQDVDNDYIQMDMVQGGRARLGTSDQRIITINEDGGNIAIGRTSASTRLHIAGTFTEDSMRELKTNITNMDNMLPAVLQMQGVKFDWRDPMNGGDDEYGFIAEDTAKILPHVVTFSEEGKPEGIQYTKMTAVLLEAIKEQQSQIDELKSKLN